MRLAATTLCLTARLAAAPGAAPGAAPEKKNVQAARQSFKPDVSDGTVMDLGVQDLFEDLPSRLASATKRPSPERLDVFLIDVDEAEKQRQVEWKVVNENLEVPPIDMKNVQDLLDLARHSPSMYETITGNDHGLDLDTVEARRLLLLEQQRMLYHKKKQTLEKQTLEKSKDPRELRRLAMLKKEAADAAYDELSSKNESELEKIAAELRRLAMLKKEAADEFFSKNAMLVPGPAS